MTVALALGAREIARRSAIVRRLEAIETLGETTVICTDKTGTLTENQIRVAALCPAEGHTEHELLAGAILASRTRTADGGVAVGDPIEAALLLAAMEHGLSHGDILGGRRVANEIPFDSERKRMTVVYEDARGREAFIKGAPEVVAERSRPDASLSERTEAWASEGLRILAVAYRELTAEAPLDDRWKKERSRLGSSPSTTRCVRPRPAQSRKPGAGIDVWMLTGDHPATARTTRPCPRAPRAGDHARATPTDKLRLVEELQAAGNVVAVTGDGVNDAPALRRADVGVAMGRSGTEAAREAAAIVIADDDFATIVTAIREGRRIGDNIRKFVAFLLSANFGEVLVFAVAVGAGMGVPLAVIQVLLVNLVTDGLPAVALSQDPPEAHTMESPPRQRTQLFDRRSWIVLGAIGVLVAAVTLAAFLAGRGFGGGVGQTMAFATIALAELVLVFAVRAPRSPAWRAGRNPALILAVAGSVLVVAASIYLPLGRELLETAWLGPAQLGIVLLLRAAANGGPRGGEGRAPLAQTTPPTAKPRITPRGGARTSRARPAARGRRPLAAPAASIQASVSASVPGSQPGSANRYFPTPRIGGRSDSAPTEMSDPQPG